MATVDSNTMFLSLKKNTFWESLHLKSGLEDWDMEEELNLTNTCDQFPQAADKEVNHHMLKWQCDQHACRQSLPRERSDAPPDESNVQPHLWMWVNPNAACPTARHLGMDATEDRSLSSSTAAAISLSSPSPSLDYSNLDCSEEDLLSSASEAEKFTEDEDAASVDIQLSQKMVEAPKSKANLAPWKAKVSRSQSRKLKYTLQAKAKTKEIWPRPPLNYCILITLALYNSAEGSLTVQQIYQFTRHHFPFFQTAPDGWKNTIRHNLCFSSSFEKTTRFVCTEGNRKARLWKLTADGRRKFEEEMQALPTEALDLVHQSMNEPAPWRRPAPRARGSARKRRAGRTWAPPSSRGPVARSHGGPQPGRAGTSPTARQRRPQPLLGGGAGGRGRAQDGGGGGALRPVSPGLGRGPQPPLQPCAPAAPAGGPGAAAGQGAAGPPGDPRCGAGPLRGGGARAALLVPVLRPGRAHAPAPRPPGPAARRPAAAPGQRRAQEGRTPLLVGEQGGAQAEAPLPRLAPGLRTHFFRFKSSLLKALDGYEEKEDKTIKEMASHIREVEKSRLQLVQAVLEPEKETEPCDGPSVFNAPGVSESDITCCTQEQPGPSRMQPLSDLNWMEKGHALTFIGHQETDGKGNIHTGAKPPWLVQDEEEAGNKQQIGPSYEEFLKEKEKQKLKKLPAERVGANFDHTSQTGEGWLPSFGRVWNHGRRWQSRHQFKAEAGKKPDTQTRNTRPKPEVL